MRNDVHHFPFNKTKREQSIACFLKIFRAKHVEGYTHLQGTPFEFKDKKALCLAGNIMIQNQNTLSFTKIPPSYKKKQTHTQKNTILLIY